MFANLTLIFLRYGLDLDGVVSFHGALSTSEPSQRGAVKAKILVCHGENDQLIPPEQVEGFKEEMQKAQADFRFISYPGAKHSFTNPDADTYSNKFDLPLGYNAEAEQKSWVDMKKFLANIFEK